jgi:hypothetical protein
MKRPGHANRLPAPPRNLVNPEEPALEEEEKRGARNDERSHDERIPDDPENRHSGSEASHKIPINAAMSATTEACINNPFS